MEDVKAICESLGIDPVLVRGTVNWYPPYHPHLVVAELNMKGGSPVAFRITNVKTGDVLSKVEESTIPGDVDDQYGILLGFCQKTQLEILPALYAALPDLDAAKVNVVRGLVVNGKQMLGDLVNGNIQNVREEAVLPVFSVEGNDIVVDLSGMREDHKDIAATALASFNVIKNTG